ncbi:MAG: hypothetical protein HY847_10585 [Betaproteobacteria bacterium]|nr:hypothetical protein [Betaproteobacteria bacterium]
MNEHALFEDADSAIDIKRLRFQAAINMFKRYLIGSRHVPNKAQEPAVFDALAVFSRNTPVAPRTWLEWFSKKQQLPQPGKMRALDKLAASAICVPDSRDRKAKALPSGMFYEMVGGGLVSAMLAPTDAKHPASLLKERAKAYEPLTTWHLHLDAIEVETIVEGFDDVTWEEVKAIAATRILEVLDDLWGPRRGAAYAMLPSSFRLKWESADTAEQESIRASYAGFKPDLFEYFMNRVAHPDWQRAGVEEDAPVIHIYKTLFAIAADTEFLVADRLSEWAMGLATAALAMHSLAWTDRYTTFGFRVSVEKLFWGAFDAIIFGTEPAEVIERNVINAMKWCNAQWSEQSFVLLLKAGEIYRSELTALGMSLDDLRLATMQTQRVHRRIYTSDQAK